MCRFVLKYKQNESWLNPYSEVDMTDHNENVLGKCSLNCSPRNSFYLLYWYEFYFKSKITKPSLHDMYAVSTFENLLYCWELEQRDRCEVSFSRLTTFSFQRFNVCSFPRKFSFCQLKVIKASMKIQDIEVGLMWPDNRLLLIGH